MGQLRCGGICQTLGVQLHRPHSRRRGSIRQLSTRCSYRFCSILLGRSEDIALTVDSMQMYTVWTKRSAASVLAIKPLDVRCIGTDS